jgi:hypothetical protein
VVAPIISRLQIGAIFEVEKLLLERHFEYELEWHYQQQPGWQHDKRKDN